MGQAKINRGLGRLNARTQPGFISVIIDQQGCLIKVPSEEKRRAAAIAQETAQQMFRTHGAAGIEDVAFTTACELVTSLQIIMGIKNDPAKMQRMQTEVACIALSLMHFEDHSFLRVTHDSAAMTTELRRLKGEDLAA